MGKHERLGYELSGGREAQIRTGGVTLSCGNASDVGRRDEQEDSFGFSDMTEAYPNTPFFAVVADGMGGLDAGRDASDFAVSEFLKCASSISPEMPIADQLKSIVMSVSRELWEADVNSGTTLAALCIFNGELNYVSVGDSRIYIIRKKTVRCLTSDHSCAAVYPGSDRYGSEHCLVSFVGQFTPAMIDVSPVGEKLIRGDRLLLCTDGVYRNISEDKLRFFVDNTKNCNAFAESIIDYIRDKNNDGDNMTAVVVEIK